jgi:hypothetical protein
MSSLAEYPPSDRGGGPKYRVSSKHAYHTLPKWTKDLSLTTPEFVQLEYALQIFLDPGITP